MTAYIVRRLLQIVPLLFLLSIFIFMLVQLAPQSAETHFMPEGASLTEEQRESIRVRLGLDQPAHVQYWRWFSSALRGDLGEALTYRGSVMDVLMRRLWPTLQLQLLTILVSIAIALPVGIISAKKRHSWTDHAVTTGSLFGLSMPDFWFALLLMLLFAVRLEWLPAYGMGEGYYLASLPNLVMPVAVLSLAVVPWFARIMRSSMLDVLSQDFVRTAAAKGGTEFNVTMKHAARVAILPVVTLIGVMFARLLSGAIVVETIFVWPGLGELAFNAVIRNDFPVILGLTMLAAVFVMVVSLIVDVLYTKIDPRISYGES